MYTAKDSELHIINAGIILLSAKFDHVFFSEAGDPSESSRVTPNVSKYTFFGALFVPETFSFSSFFLCKLTKRLE